ncbi:MAG: nucleoside triphosphate pyrophosphohydrolase [Candidatus Aureabacteria bacterium]|nr:nucleoside triphosphate pyrophosphohydrolase [Candidatus Auribacterota bacterium]
MTNHSEFEQLIKIMEQLRKKCPWDMEQTHESLIPYLREESFEVIEAVLSGKDHALCDELGDLLLQVVFHAVVAKDRDSFTITDVIKAINHKLIRRHPHVFDPKHVQRETLDDQWQNLKKSEKSSSSCPGHFHSIPENMDSFLASERIQLLSAKDHFQWKSVNGILEKLEEEIKEFRKAHGSGKRKHLQEELGDMLFVLVNLCFFLMMNPSDLIAKANAKFKKRYDKMVALAKQDHPHTPFRKLSLATQEIYWQKAKKSKPGTA